MKLFSKISVAVVVGLGFGMGTMALIDASDGSASRADAVMSLFKTYCAPLHLGERVAYRPSLVLLDQIPGDRTYVDVTSKLTVSREKNVCRVSDELQHLSPAERTALTQQLTVWIESTTNLIPEQNHGLESWHQYDLWSDGIREAHKKQAVYITRVSEGGEHAATWITYATPNAPAE